MKLAVASVACLAAGAAMLATAVRIMLDELPVLWRLPAQTGPRCRCGEIGRTTSDDRGVW
jgi:hypothetical protein